MGVPALAQSSDSSGSGLEKHNAAADVAAQSSWSKDAPTLLAVNGEVVVAVAAQATPRQSSSRYSVRVGEAIEAPSMKLCGDLPGLRRLHWATTSLSRSCCMSRLLPGENLTPPIGMQGLGHPLDVRPHSSCGRGQLRFFCLWPGPFRPGSAPPRPMAAKR
jgi:hypothetical protein